MDLTKEEEEIILKIREQKERNTPRFYATLKHTLYVFSGGRYLNFEVDIKDQIDERAGTCTEDKLPKIYEKFKAQALEYLNRLNKIEKGIVFECFLTSSGKEKWFIKDNSSPIMIGGLDADWAKENLENIKPCQKS